MSRLLLLFVVGGLVALPTSASGQVCSGGTAFAQRPIHAFGSATFGDDARSFAGGVTFGGSGAFGQLLVATTSFDNVDGSAFSFAGGAGYQVSLDKRNLVHLCPIASLAFSSGPNDIDVRGDGSIVLDVSETDFQIGVAVGAVASRSGQTQVIPTGTIAFVSGTAKVEDQVSGASESASETFGLLVLGLGFVFNEVVTVRPGVAIPLGLEGASTSFGLTLSVGFGRRSN